MTSNEKVNAESRDWEILRASRPEDYVGATGFEQMNALQRLRWLDLAVDFVARRGATTNKPILTTDYTDGCG